MKSIVGLGCQLGRCEPGGADVKTLPKLSGELCVLVDNGMLPWGGVLSPKSSHLMERQAGARLVQKRFRHSHGASQDQS